MNCPLSKCCHFISTELPTCHHKGPPHAPTSLKADVALLMLRTMNGHSESGPFFMTNFQLWKIMASYHYVPFQKLLIAPELLKWSCRQEVGIRVYICIARGAGEGGIWVVCTQRCMARRKRQEYFKVWKCIVRTTTQL